MDTFKRSTLFVSIVAYRDPAVGRTVNDLYAKARHPDRIRCGILIQGDEGHVPHDRHRHVTRVPHQWAKGPLYARQWVLQNVYAGEEYYLQIDSHMTFLKDWDSQLLDELYMTAHPHTAVITCYPVPSKRLGEEHMVPQMNTASPYIKDARVQKYGATLTAPGVRPIETPYLAAGFFFAHKTVLDAYPRVSIPFLFQGEEMLLCESFRSHGLRFYAPTRNILGHSYGRHGEPKVWHDTPGWDGKERKALQELVEYLKGPAFHSR